MRLRERTKLRMERVLLNRATGFRVSIEPIRQCGPAVRESREGKSAGTTPEAKREKQLDRQNRELRRVKEIFRSPPPPSGGVGDQREK
ncbi:hypothetical protein GCM10027597_27910 [Saccharopolyspora tripterygii]